MANKRKPAQEFILKYIEKIAGPDNKALYEQLFKGMNDADFKEFMLRLRAGKSVLSIIAPNGMDKHITIKNNFKVGKEIGYEFFQHLVFEGDRGLPPYVTPNKYLVYKLPIRRVAQLLTKGIAVPDGDKSIDLTTGQVTGKSKASKITLPETQLLTGMGLKASVVELLKYRGGDLGAKNAMSQSLYKLGKVDAATLEEHSTGVVASKTLDSYFKASHIRSTGLV